MGDILNITNGDGAIGIMKTANIPGAFLPWRDVLHEGPVPQGLSLAELSQVRAEFIISRGWGTPENVKQDFIERDNVLKSYANYKKVILWFEHDLYDQLQIRSWLDMVVLDRWIGGVHLTPGNMWCWDSGILRHQEG